MEVPREHEELEPANAGSTVFPLLIGFREPVAVENVCCLEETGISADKGWLEERWASVREVEIPYEGATVRALWSLSSLTLQRANAGESLQRRKVVPISKCGVSSPGSIA